MLARELCLPVAVEQFVGSWIPIAAAEQTQLSGDPLSDNPFCRLSAGAIGGGHIWDVEGAFRVVIGPLGPADFRRLLPSGPDLGKVRDFVRLYAPPHLRFTIRLLLSPDAVPEPRLSAGDDAIQLNWTSWLRSEHSLGSDADVELAG
jgi:type VI secretion system protein ImpH